MKKIGFFLATVVIIFTVFWSFSDMLPSKNSTPNFSLDNALHHLKNISKKEHYVGSNEHKLVQNYIVSELQKLGLETKITFQTTVNKKWYAATTTENIIARIRGTHKGKALLLLTHYDSSPHSSLGASDAGSGVVTLLEGIRGFLANNTQPKNDVIILISDAEELGLLGAKSFVDTNSWAKDVGLVLNFEARGSGGPSYMLMETNSKNGKLLSEFIKAKPNYPAANSLMYSVYKKLPNDTDLTVFREEGNIDGFNFAFIGDHFDYHTVQDSYERLDRETLMHQADYLTATLNYFSNSDLENFHSKQDFVYVNFPFVKLLTYPFSWGLALLIIAMIFFLILVFLGVRLNKITPKGIFKGAIPFLLSLLVCPLLSFSLWKLLLLIHPAYKDILHGFTYNGYQYIIAFVFMNLWLLFSIYKKYFNHEKATDILIAPLFFWIIINGLIYFYLPGAGFFIIPVFVALLVLVIQVFINIQTTTKPLLFAIFSIPTIYIFAPLIKMFPVGLGLKNLFIAAIFLVLVFGLITPIFYQPKSRKRLTKLIGFSAILFFFIATIYSGFSVDRKKPNSIVYIQNSDEKTAYFGTYNHTLDAYTKQVFDKDFIKGGIPSAETKSKYNSRFSYHKKTEFKNIPTSTIVFKKDTIIDNKRFVDFTITPKRKINKIEFITKHPFAFNKLYVNGLLVNKEKPYFLRNGGTFLIYYLGNSDKKVSIQMKFDKNNMQPKININEISYDLLTHKNFNLQPRTQEMMPMPFVTNDAIIVTQKLKL